MNDTNGYVIALDLDGVLADCSGSMHHYDNSNLQLFHEEMPDFPVIPSGVVIYNFFVTQAQIIAHAIKLGNVENAEIPCVDIWTARPERLRKMTVEWFEKNGLLAPRKMLMREDLDMRDHGTIKLEFYKKHYKGKEELLCLFDDNNETINKFRSEGLTCYHA